MVEAYQRLGGLESFLGEVQQAESDYEHSLSWAQEVWRHKPDDPARAKLLATTYIGLGSIQLDNLEPDKALKNFRAALEVFGSDTNGSLDHDRTVFRLNWFLGRALTESGSQSNALAILRKSVAVAEEVARTYPSSRQAKRDLFVAYYYIAGPLSGQETLNIGDTKGSQVYARKAFAIAEQIASEDSKNAQGKYDVGFAYEGLGDAFRVTRPAVAAEYYRKAIAIAREMAADSHEGREAQFLTAERDEELAAVLVAGEQAPERIHVLKLANRIWERLSSSGHGERQDHLYLMRSYCKLSDAELAVDNLAQARQFANSAVLFFTEFTLASADLFILRDVGFCYKSLGNLQHRIAVDRSVSASERDAAEADSQQWYRRSEDAWNEWNRRGAATPESESERRKVERLLRAAARGRNLRTHDNRV
jgi:tetratricopeptide (TPR) repeat protein